MYGVADLGADEGLVAEVVVAVFKLKLYDQEVNGLYRGVTGWAASTIAIYGMPSTMTLTGQIQDNDASAGRAKCANNVTGNSC